MSCGLLKERIADAVSGAHDDICFGGGEASAQARHCAFERVGSDVFAERVERFFQLTATNDLLRSPQQLFEQRHLSWWNVDALLVDRDRARGRVQRDIAELQDNPETRARTTQQRAATSSELRNLEWFDEVIVGAAVEPDQTIVEPTARGENQDRNGIVGLPQLAHQVHAVAV